MIRMITFSTFHKIFCNILYQTCSDQTDPVRGTVLVIWSQSKDKIAISWSHLYLVCICSGHLSQPGQVRGGGVTMSMLLPPDAGLPVFYIIIITQ